MSVLPCPPYVPKICPDDEVVVSLDDAPLPPVRRDPAAQPILYAVPLHRHLATTTTTENLHMALPIYHMLHVFKQVAVLPRIPAVVRITVKVPDQGSSSSSSNALVVLVVLVVMVVKTDSKEPPRKNPQTRRIAKKKKMMIKVHGALFQHPSVMPRKNTNTKEETPPIP